MGAPEVARSEGEEDLEGAEILKLSNDLVSYTLPILRGPWNLLKYCARVLQLVDNMPPTSNTSLPLHSSEIRI